MSSDMLGFPLPCLIALCCLCRIPAADYHVAPAAADVDVGGPMMCSR